MNDRLEEWKALLADKTGKLSAAVESGEMVDHFAQAITALEAARADAARLKAEAKDVYYDMNKIVIAENHRAEAAEADRDRWKARAERLEKLLLGADCEMLEAMSAVEHDRWAGWYKWQRDNSTPERIERWNKLAITPYSDLSDALKEKDRQEVIRILAAGRAALEDEA